MKILHTGDIHLGELAGPEKDRTNLRLMDTFRCMQHIAITADKEQPDVIIIAGDLFHRAKQWEDQALKEIGLASEWLRALAAIAPTVLIFGTRNHDNPEAFENIRDKQIPGLIVVTDPIELTINTPVGPLQVAVVPGIDKGRFREMNPGMDPQEENDACSQILGDLILGMSTQIDRSIPSVLVSHYTVVGCQLDNGEHVFLNHEVVLPKEALAASAFDLVTLGHIHRAQSVDGCGIPVYYCGAINRITFNEEDQAKGFWMHEIESDLPYDRVIESTFIETPARTMTTIKLEEDEDYNWPAIFAENPVEAVEFNSEDMFRVKNCIIRVHYSCDEETRKRMNHKAIEQALYSAGAFYVSEIKPVDVITALGKQELAETEGPLENLAAWLKTEGFEPEEIQALIDLALPMVNIVSAKMPTGKLSGIFEPISLEVKHYRSYQHELFNFSEISFAMVNGPNGVGKSAFFMDAIKDCLYEETREDELTGWISNDAKSGSIIFTFAMGDSRWRVTRTRAKSGATTLALHQLVEEEWANMGDTKKDLTQAKIISLLGMDAMTFGSCALIMQDQYGRFLEADKTARMEVLGNILGLGIYEQLLEMAKAKVTETNRELELAKAKAETLRQKLIGKPALEEEQTQIADQLLTIEHDIKVQEGILNAVQDHIKSLELRQMWAMGLKKQIEAHNRDTKNKEEEIGQHDLYIKTQQKILDAEEIILARVKELEETQTQITTIQAKLPQFEQLKTSSEQTIRDIDHITSERTQLQTRVASLEEELKNREAYEQAAVDYKQTMADIAAHEEKARKYNEIKEQIRAAEKLLEELSAELDRKNIELKNCAETAMILANSNCIDPAHAQCNFLINAHSAKARKAILENEIAGIQLQRQPLIDEIESLEQQQGDIGYDMDTHYEAKMMAEELRPKSERAAQMAGKVELLETLKKQIEQQTERLTTLGNSLHETNCTMDTLLQEIAPLAELEAKLPRLKKWAEGKDRLPVAREIVKSSTEAIEKLQGEIDAATKEVVALTEKVATIDQEIEDLPEKQENARNISEDISNMQKNTNTLRMRLGAVESQLEAMAKDEEELSRTNEEMEPMAKSLVRYQILTKAFGFDGIPFSIVRYVVPELSNMANEILAQMTGGKMALEMKTERIQKSNKKEVNALEIWITDYMRGSLPYKSRSGGQKVKAALSVAFALADLKASRAGIQLGMMFVDEPPFLDADGVDAYCDALELLYNRYANMKVLAISHDFVMKARFLQQIEVEDRGEEGSKIRVVA